ncbi:MAG TPA: OmpA family protein [Bryobacteraceae bacterium]|nr:OmpA family protein [Bryobacteraceae bacterium]
MKSKVLAALCVLSITTLTVGCAKKVAATTPPKAPAPVMATAAQANPAPASAPQAPAGQSPVASAARSTAPDAATKAKIQDLLNRIQDAYFDYNQQNIRTDAEAALRADAKTLAEILHDYPDYKLTIEGYCDERGSEEYNLALGDARANRAKTYLSDTGIPASQFRIVSYGKDRPVCSESTEECWQKNRRAHITQNQ